jgi:hypothetical protein
MKLTEKRKHLRIKAGFFAVFRRLREKENPLLLFFGYTDNISPEGLFFFTRNELKEGHEIGLTIYPSGRCAECGISPTLKGMAKILRVVEQCREKASPFADLRCVAVQFTDELTMSLST